MAEPRADVRNAADPQQVNRARRKERDQRGEYLTALRATMSTPTGRRVFWELLTIAGVFRSIWHPSAEIHYKAGRQDFGHELMADLLEADEQLYLEMEREARARGKREASSTDAAHTASPMATTEAEN